MISIVVVTHNSEKHIKECLHSVGVQPGEDVQLIVVDNASEDGTKKIIKEFFPWAFLIENQQNKGAAQARNQAIGLARGAWVLTLDSDVVLEAGFMEVFLSRQAFLPEGTGMVQPHILSGDGKRVYSQGIHLSWLRRFFDINQGVPFPCGHGQAVKAIGPCAAAAFYRRSMLEKLKEPTGYFDERFFFLVEDVDLAWRAHKSGWKVVFMPELVCRHEGDGSKTGKRRRQYLCWRNRHLMIAKNESLSGKLWVYFISVPYELARLVLLCFSRIKKD